MNAGKVISFILLGAVIGVTASWRIAQKRSKKEADEDVASVKKAYSEALDEHKDMFQEYRNKVIAKYGEEVDKQFMGPFNLLREKTDTTAQYRKEQENIADNQQYRQIIKSCGYSSEQPKTNYARVEDVNKREIKDLPYVIKDDCYGEYDYEQLDLRYDINMGENEIRLYDETTNQDEDPMTTLGKDVLEFIDNQLEFCPADDGSEETATVYVRDDIVKVDYRIDIYRW